MSDPVGLNNASSFPTRLLAITAMLLMVAVAVHLNRAGANFFGWRKIAVTGIQPEKGFAFLANTSSPAWSSHAQPSIAQVLEDNVPLPGPANSLHDDIRQIGRGRYSFWHESVYFSSRDNTDPTANGRTYEVFGPRVVSRASAVVIDLATSCFLLATGFIVSRSKAFKNALTTVRVSGFASSRARDRILLALSLGFILALFVATRLPFYWHYPFIGIAPDSTTYLESLDAVRNHHWPLFITRTPGYPFFLGLITFWVDRWWAVAAGQSVLALASVSTALVAIYRLRAFLVIPAALALGGFMASSQVLIYETYILSDSVYCSLTIFSVAFLLLALANKRPWAFGLASLAMAGTILVRPSGLYLLVIFFLTAGYLWWNKYHRRMLRSFLLPLPTVLLAFCAYNYFTFGQFVLSAFGEANLAGATILYWEPDPQFPPALNRALAALPESYARQNITPQDFARLNESWDPQVTFVIFLKAFNSMTRVEGWVTGTKLQGAGAIDRGLYGNYLRNRSYLKAASFRAVARHPDLYVKFIWTNFRFFFDEADYKFDFYRVLAARAKTIFVDGLDPTLTKEYARGIPPRTINLTGTGENTSVALQPDLMRDAHVRLQSWQWSWFQRIGWVWTPPIALLLSTAQLVRSRGRHLGAFILCTLSLMVFGAVSVVCLVEMGLERYSYPTEFIYYLLPALLPLIWLKPNLASGGSSASPSIADPNHRVSD